MENRLIMSWKAREGEHKPKSRPWYWMVGIVAGGMAIAAIILKDYLFALIAVLAGFTVMLVGTRKPPVMEYALYEHDLVIGAERIPYEKIRRFAIKEDEPRMLDLEIQNLVGSAHIPLEGADWRRIRMELKNRNIDEAAEIGVFATKVAKWMGL